MHLEARLAMSNIEIQQTSATVYRWRCHLCSGVGSYSLDEGAASAAGEQHYANEHPAQWLDSLDPS